MSGTCDSAARRVVRVEAPSRAYDVVVGAGVLDELGETCRRAAGGTRCCLVSDDTVAGIYAGRALGSLEAAGYDCRLLTFPAGEASKRLGTLERLLEGVAEAGLTRDDLVVALGGGVTGDMAGLVAALYLRGVQVVQVPTSLLAMVDSSVGGKTAVDLGAGKNLAGAFLQPSAVLADVRCLSTVPPELFRDSCGEVIKHGVLADPDLLSELEARPLTEPGRPEADLVRVVARNVEIKRDVVAADERERGLRQTLNLGHTIGHAVEAASGFALGHGSCVAVGLCCMARAAERLGWCEPGLAGRVGRVVAAHGLPIDTDLPHDVIVGYAAHDKKRHADGVNVVVPVSVGRSEVRRVSLGEFRRIVDLGCGTSAR